MSRCYQRRGLLKRAIGRALVLTLIGLTGWLLLPGRLRERIEPTAYAINYSVTNTNDSGAGSLRQAIMDANDTPSPFLARITFNISGSGVKTINVLSPLPPLTYTGMIIDGTTQPGYAGAPLIELNGANAGSGVIGLNCQTSVTIKGLVINRFLGGAGIGLSGGSSIIVGNYIGTDATGNSARGNGAGIVSFSSNNVIGGTTAADRNVISANNPAGIAFIGGNQNLVQGNYIGTNAAGNAPLGNVSGITLERNINGTTNNNNLIGGTTAGARNIISGNFSDGILIAFDSGSNNLVQGNFIGTDVTGTLDFGNGGNGIRVHSGSQNNTIGGTSSTTPGAACTGACNLISGNGGEGIGFSSSSGNLVQGNYIGTDVTGTQQIGNSGGGIRILESSSNQIGGTTAAARNVISGNFDQGVEIYGSSSTGNTIQGNYIGTDVTGTATLGNFLEGVAVRESAFNNSLGGTASGAGNVIAYNRLEGVSVESSCVRNAIQGNSIFANGSPFISPGIELLPPNGITPNDFEDADTGANNLQNFPVLTSAISSDAGTTIQGTLHSTPGRTFRLEMFANRACDSSGNGEGEAFIGFKNVNTNGNGNASFSLTVPTASITGPFLTATATDVNGNTSEFSQCLSTCIAMLTPTSASFPGNVGTGTPSLTGTVDVTMPAGCNWTAVSNDGFITITSGSSGSGNGTVSYSLTVNPSNTTRRSGTITIAGQNLTLLQGPQFLDVPTNHLFYTFIGKLAARGVTLGCGGGNYCPESNVTREQMAAFIIRARGEFIPPTPASQRFNDVPPSNPFYNFIDRMAVLQITLGCSGNPPLYCPSNSVTREQMAAFIIRALHEPGYLPPTPGSQRFNDVPPSNPFYAHIEEMAVRQITLGCSASPPLYCPGDAVTRAQMAAFLVRAFKL